MAAEPSWRLRENSPPDLDVLAGLLQDPDDLFLVWPLARRPFDRDQWQEALDPAAGHRSFLVVAPTERGEEEVIGHVALRRTDRPDAVALSFFYLKPDRRDRGLGQQIVAAVLDQARSRMSARTVKLRVRTYNPRAGRCYEKCGFTEESRDGDLVIMSRAV